MKESFMTQTTNTNGLTNADYRKNSFEPTVFSTGIPKNASASILKSM